MYLRRLYPTPRFFAEDEEIRFSFGCQLTMNVNFDLPEDVKARICTLWHNFSFTASELEWNCVKDDSGAFMAIVGKPKPAVLEGSDSYAIHVDADGISVALRDEKAAVVAFSTLVQLICPAKLEEGCESLYISAADIHDKEQLSVRAVHLCVFPETNYLNLQKMIHLVGFLKFTHVILEFWGTFPYECLPELAWKEKHLTKEQVKALVALIRSYGMEPVPMFNHVGHACQTRNQFGKHTVLDNNPRLARLFEPDAYSWCVSNPEVHVLLKNVRKELYEVFGEGTYFHVGGDEAFGFGTCDVCRKKAAGDLLAEFLNGLCEEVIREGRRPLLWHDMLLSTKDFKRKEDAEGIVTNGDDLDTAPALKKLDRRFVIADWEYFYKGDALPSAAYFAENGFETVLCSSGEPDNNKALAVSARKFGSEGIMLTTWANLEKIFYKVPELADIIWGFSVQKEPENCNYWLNAASHFVRTLCPPMGQYNNCGWIESELSTISVCD